MPGLLLCGGITAYWFYDGYRKVWKPYREYRPALCRVLDKRLEKHESSEGVSYKPSFKLTVLAADRSTHGFDLWGEGTTSARAQKVLDRYPLGRDLPCWHPPGRPDAAVLDRAVNPWWIGCGVFLVPCTLLFLVMTAFGLWDWRRGK